MGNETCYIVQFLVKCAKIYHIKTNNITINGSQLAKMKKYIPNMFLP